MKLDHYEILYGAAAAVFLKENDIELSNDYLALIDCSSWESDYESNDRKRVIKDACVAVELDYYYGDNDGIVFVIENEEQLEQVEQVADRFIDIDKSIRGYVEHQRCDLYAHLAAENGSFSGGHWVIFLNLETGEIFDKFTINWPNPSWPIIEIWHFQPDDCYSDDIFECYDNNWDYESIVYDLYENGRISENEAMRSLQNIIDEEENPLYNLDATRICTELYDEAGLLEKYYPLDVELPWNLESELRDVEYQNWECFTYEI